MPFIADSMASLVSFGVHVGRPFFFALGCKIFELNPSPMNRGGPMGILNSIAHVLIPHSENDSLLIVLPGQNVTTMMMTSPWARVETRCLVNLLQSHKVGPAPFSSQPPHPAPCCIQGKAGNKTQESYASL